MSRTQTHLSCVSRNPKKWRHIFQRTHLHSYIYKKRMRMIKNVLISTCFSSMASKSHWFQFRKVNSWVLFWVWLLVFSFFFSNEGMLKTCLIDPAEWQQHCEHLNIKCECTEPCGRLLCEDKYVRHHVEHKCHLWFLFLGGTGDKLALIWVGKK